MDVTGMSALPPTPAALVAAIKRACERPLTKADRREQRLSFVMGQLPEGNTLTRDEVRAILDRFDGIPAAVAPALAQERIRKAVVAACFDPGLKAGSRGTRSPDEWRADAVMAVLKDLGVIPGEGGRHG